MHMKNKYGFAIFASIIVLVICVWLSLMLGTVNVDAKIVLDFLFEKNTDTYEYSIVAMRFPRVIFGIIAGSALSISGLLMQSITRNPVADPSILGVNTGASLFVVCGMAFFNIRTNLSYIAFAFIGALVTTVIVFLLASFGKGGATPIKLALAGTATATALQSLVNAIMLPNSRVMDQFRFWQVGSIGAASWDDIKIMLPFVMAGLILSICIVEALNILSLGDDSATALGINVKLVRALGCLGGVLLCASVTALAGPIGFIGLMVPHVARLLLGPNLKALLPFSMIGGSCVLLVADLLGRILGRPGEIESGIITALLGAPVFIYIVRKVKV